MTLLRMAGEESLSESAIEGYMILSECDAVDNRQKRDNDEHYKSAGNVPGISSWEGC